MKVIKIKRAAKPEVKTVKPDASAPDKKEGRILSARNETKLKQALSMLQDVLRQVDGGDLIEGKTLVVWREGNQPVYGLVHSVHGEKGEASRVERLVSKEGDLGEADEYPLAGHRKTGRLDFIATAALTEITLEDVGELVVKACKEDEEDDENEDESNEEDEDSEDEDDSDEDDEDEEGKPNKKGKRDVSSERRDSSGRWTSGSGKSNDEDEDEQADQDDEALDELQDQLDTWMNKPRGPRNTLVDQMRFLRVLEAKVDDVGESAPSSHGAMRIEEMKRDIVRIRTRLNRNSKAKHDVSKESRDAGGRWTHLTVGGDVTLKRDLVSFQGKPKTPAGTPVKLIHVDNESGDAVVSPQKGSFHYVHADDLHPVKPTVKPKVEKANPNEGIYPNNATGFAAALKDMNKKRDLLNSVDAEKYMDSINITFGSSLKYGGWLEPVVGDSDIEDNNKAIEEAPGWIKTSDLSKGMDNLRVYQHESGDLLYVLHKCSNSNDEGKGGEPEYSETGKFIKGN